MRRQEPEVPLRTGLPAKTAGRNCQEVPPPGGTPGCRATAVGDAGWLSVPWGKPSVAPTSCPGNFLSRPPSFLPPLLASGNPCPWQYVHLSGSQDRLAPTCLKAGIHPKRSDLAPGVASTLTDRTCSAMGTYTYTYTSRPRALPCQRRRYRDHLMQLAEEPVHHGNIMYDRRVVRGNTYALHTGPLLFDFDLEVKPMLEVLVGKTIEQSLLEVMEEEELANLRASQYAYEELRNVELAEVQRLAEQEKRHREEKERRKRQQWEVVYKHSETAQKVAARAFAQRYLADLLPSVFDSLRDGGYFYDPVERDIEIGFLPWLMNEVDKTMEYSMVGRTVLDMLIREVVEKRLAAYEQRDDQPPAGKPKDELGGSGRTTEPPVGYELQEQSTAQPQRPPLGRDSLQRTPDDGRYMESVLAQETKLMEEGEYEQTKIRKTSGTEVLQPRGDFQP
uniref:Radial spoke head 3 n=1 Tax=Felis catus TaxID=9685 RepID=A0ABI7YBF3_FELCA